MIIRRHPLRGHKVSVFLLACSLACRMCQEPVSLLFDDTDKDAAIGPNQRRGKAQ
jgi:hypothetical protein